jgi:ABC-2 type transport system permease protein
MRKILMIVRREYLEIVRTKAFWIGMLAFPLFVVGLFGIQIAMAVIAPQEQKRIVVLDATGAMADPVSEALARHTLDGGSPEFVVEILPVEGGLDDARSRQERRVLDGELYGIVTIGTDIEDQDNFRFYRKNVGDERTRDRVQDALHDAVVELRLERSSLGIDKATLDALTAGIRFESYQVTEGGEAKKKGFFESYFATLIFVMMLYFMLYFYGFTVTRGVIQEKSSRVMEVLLGSVSPDQLMTGKILGIGFAGLTQTVFYVATAIALRVAASVFFAAREGGMDLTGFTDAVAPAKLLFFLVYFLLGYFLFVTFFAIIGAVCNSEQEAQSLQLPVIFMLMIPMLSTFFFVQHPDAPAAVALSLVPIFAPMLMFMRITVLSPPAWQILLSVVLLIVSIWAMFRIAAKVFRIGTLMYGKRPTVREIWRWARI